ncbi:uncharacterized protein LOC117170935 [Belonocnema kinseyi]|uniref:uncharacterized protein LOC117170935 n=1 Tax=Belonocnema kinseyi TaxID=2817044 RepID=UPI00143E08F3|nr:uncharacterized protein LOC117170935 [Belonocnema kinseyi]
MAGSRSRTTQRLGTSVSATGQGEQAGPQSSSSSDRSSSLVGNLVNVESNITSQNVNVDQQITLPFSRCRKAKNRCLICRSSGQLVVVPSEVKLRLFVNRGIIIQGQCRCCKRHLKGKFFKQNEESRVPKVSDTTTMTSTEVCGLLNDPRHFSSRRSLNFDAPGALSDTDYIRLTSITSFNFENLHDYISGSVKNTANRSSRTCLAILLMKLRTGLSHSILATLFLITRRSVGRAITSARKALMNKFVPFHLGLHHISREDFINLHTRELAQALFADGKDVAILVADGTYIYMEKSSNYVFQRRNYSVHKGRPLVKPMMVVSTTGYILEIYGPYFADGKNNDASILNSLMRQETSPFLEWTEAGDVMVVDRGFRDSIATLEEYGFIPAMPGF